MKNTHNNTDSRLLLIFLILFGLSFAFYFTFRYGGQWVEGDTASLTYRILVMQSEATLIPEEAIYTYGFLFQVISILVSNLSGINVINLQETIYPFVSILLLITSSWYFYTQDSHDAGPAALAVLLLCFQADVLFVIFRGSHEKITWPLVMLSLGLLFSSLGKQGVSLILHITLFYMVAFALISVNIFFASTFLAAILLSLLIGFVIYHLQSIKTVKSNEHPGRLLYITLTVSVLLFVFIAYLYLPALNNLRTANTIYQQVQNLFVNPEAAVQPYDYIAFGWINTATYLGLSIFTWLLIIGSMLVWLLRGWRLLRGREPFTLKDNLDWLLYAGFALQVGVYIFIDLSGALASNFQLRVFPGFTVLAVLILSKGIFKLLSDIKLKPAFRSTITVIGITLVLWLPIAALLKASNEPLLSNMWTIYSMDEIQAVEWGGNHLENTDIWVGIDNRLKNAYSVGYDIPNGNYFRTFGNYKYIRHVIYSQKDILRAERTGFPLPPVFGWLQVYDNGEVQFLKKPPVTPFQR